MRGGTAGLADSDRDVVGFLRRAGLPAGEGLLDGPARVKRTGGRAHARDAA
ncbi:hypothetical protein [Streptomyces sp.]|uniref:hypothetical protein n=1 Tax=Streptomyces sp. TaxID=1931 RepID=UPI0028116051|nr:hypothetical protein [Streptomyces sp.]